MARPSARLPALPSSEGDDVDFCRDADLVWPCDGQIRYQNTLAGFEGKTRLVTTQVCGTEAGDMHSSLVDMHVRAAERRQGQGAARKVEPKLCNLLDRAFAVIEIRTMSY